MAAENNEVVEHLVALDEKGLIMAPGETLDDFFKRAGSREKFDDYLAEAFRERGSAEFYGIQLREEDRFPAGVMQECLRAIASRYKTLPDWIPVFLAKEVGLFWGGAAVGFRDTEGLIEKDAFFAIVQLRTSFRSKKRFLIYDRDEILSHEACHIVRMAFGQEVYEEPLAYLLSKTGFRRYLGPILRNMRDFTVFAMFFLLFMIVQVLSQVTAVPDLIYWASKIPFVLFVMYLGVLNHGVHSRLLRAAETLRPVFGENAEAVLLRCSDGEIDEIARIGGIGASDKAEEMLRRKAQGNIRWQVIFRRFAAS